MYCILNNTYTARSTIAVSEHDSISMISKFYRALVSVSQRTDVCVCVCVCARVHVCVCVCVMLYEIVCHPSAGAILSFSVSFKF